MGSTVSPQSPKGYGVAVAGAGNTQKPAQFLNNRLAVSETTDKMRHIFIRPHPGRLFSEKSPRNGWKMGTKPPEGQMARVTQGEVTGPTETLQSL